MSQEVLLRGLFSGIMSIAFAWIVYSRQEDLSSGTGDENRQKYLPDVPGMILPLFLLTLTLMGLYHEGVLDTAKMVLSLCFSIFVHICVFYLVLLLILPTLRKHISARACAMLWLLPNYLYVVSQAYMELPSPRWVITVPGKLVWALLAVWFLGFVLVLLWKIFDHLCFRRRVLRDAVPADDPALLSVWNAIVADSRIKKPKFKLVISPNVSTSLTVGLYKRATRVVLPEKAYAAEELEMIFRHEIIHISREDSWNKFFLVFCTAMCWFNPLMWIAMRKSADDLELCCDETVLLNADQATRNRYARLLLDTAGNERGFTTCLSASANAMRYRLRNVTKPAKRHSGALIVGAVFFLLCMTSGYICLAYDGDTGANRIYSDNSIEDYQVRNIMLSDDDYARNYTVLDEKAFHKYLAGLDLYCLSGNYSFSDSEKTITYLMDTPQGTLALVLNDHCVKIVPLYGQDVTAEYYYVPDGIDWDYLSTIILEHPAMNVRLYDEQDAYGYDLKTLLTKLWKIEDGQRQLLYEEIYPEGEHHGLFTSSPFPYSGTLTATYELAEPCTVIVESWDYTACSRITQPDLIEDFTIDLSDQPAHYTVHAKFCETDGVLYEAQFQFSIGQIGSK